jgi:hypothetical protein
MQHPGWTLIVIGLLIVGIGVLWVSGVSLSWLGHLPGDIRIENENTRVYIPITTCILFSLVLSGVLWVIRLLFR